MVCPVCNAELVNTDGRYRCPEKHGCMIEEGVLINMRLQGHISTGLSEEAPTNRRHGHIDCPNCGARMERRHYKNSTALVDECESCGFMWFDKGELRKVFIEAKI